MSINKYTHTAIALHWWIALLFIPLGVMGLIMAGLSPNDPLKFKLYQLHKSIGIVILCAMISRLVWRVIKAPPPLPIGQPQWSKRWSGRLHRLFYLLLFILPLSGWVIVSTASIDVPTVVFNIVPVPHLPLQEIADQVVIYDRAHSLHKFLFFFTIGLVLLHVAASLWHQFIVKDQLLKRIFSLAGVLGALLAIAITIALGSRIMGGVTTERESLPAIRQITHPHWYAEASNSSLQFRGIQEGEPFTGHFASFSAHIAIEDDLSQSFVRATINTDSVNTGDTERDETIKNADWFDVQRHPIARFQSTKITAVGDDMYQVTGSLHLRGINRTIVLPMHYIKNGDTARSQAQITLNRHDFGVGQGVWVSDEWVGAEVEVWFTLNLTRR